MNKEQKIWTIITIATVSILVLIFTGITYAFFTTSDNNGSTAEIITDSGKMIITYADGGSNLLVSDNISPSNKIIADKTFTLTGLNTATAGEGLAMPYKVGLKYTSTFSDGQIHYYIKKINSTNEDITTSYSGTLDQTILGYDAETGYATGTLYKNVNYLEIVSGKFPASDNEQSITFNLKLQFPDTGENQDTEKGKSVNAMVVVNYEPAVNEHIASLYESKEKDENGITIDGLQKDGTGSINQTLLSSSNNKYNATLLNNLLADTETDEYDNLRYVGANPNNYISFNNETWRIIGLFNVYNNDTNKYEKLIKIIRNESIGGYSWDSSDANTNSGWGIKDWKQADLMTELNTDYIDISKTSGTTFWYNNSKNQQTEIFDFSKNIKSTYIDKIANVKWYLGGVKRNPTILNTYDAYLSEKTTSDYWNGKIGLIYASDYGYASTYSACRNDVYSATNDIPNCQNENWLYYKNNNLSITPLSDDNYRIFYVRYDGYGFNTLPCNPHGVRPTLYLKSDVVITSGTGSKDSPYTIK